MIFKETHQQVLDGTKTQTRRVRKPGDRGVTRWAHTSDIVQVVNIERDPIRVKWQLGKDYAVQPGRGKKSIGRTPPIKAIRRERLQEISVDDLIAEGFGDVDGAEVGDVLGFIFTWNSLYRKPYPLYDDEGNIVGYLKCSWEDNPEVWVLEFGREA